MCDHACSKGAAEEGLLTLAWLDSTIHAGGDVEEAQWENSGIRRTLQLWYDTF